MEYDRERAVAYARRWALGRNPRYYDFSELGGDCTNFASQCIYAGAGVMNDTPVTGWFYRRANDRTASWTAARYLYRFLTSNEGVGPYGLELPMERAEPADIIQLTFDGQIWTHSMPVVGFRDGVPLVAAHTQNALDRPLTGYTYRRARLVHIAGVRR